MSKEIEFNDVEQELIENCARGKSHKEIAELSGYSVRQVQRKLSRQHFKAAVREMQNRLWDNRIRRMQNHFDSMEKVVTDVMNDEEAQTWARLQAATLVKTMCFHGRELDVQREVDELRSALEAIQSQLNGGPAVKLLGADHLCNDDDDEDGECQPVPTPDAN